MGCDEGKFMQNETNANFNPRSPNGLRQQLGPVVERLQFISIHAARMGCDAVPNQGFRSQKYFNPRSPNGLRRRSV